MEAFESSGIWWLPEAPETRIVGMLSYLDEDGFRLKIPFGNLGGPEQFVSHINQQPSTTIIHGTLQNGKTATLIDCVLTNFSMKTPGMASEEYRALKGYLGDVQSNANPLIDCVNVSYDHLRDWIMSHPSKLTLPSADKAFGLSADFHYETPEDSLLVEIKGCRILLGHTASLTFPSVKGFRVEHDCKLTLEFKEPLALDEVETKYLSPIWSFLSFCLDRNIHTTHLKVRLAGNEEQWLMIGRAQSVTPSSEELIMEPFMLLPMPRIAERINDILTRWLSIKGDEYRAVSLMVGLLSERNVPSDLRFLASAQALEALSRVDANEYELDSKDFDRRIAIISTSVNEKRVREWALRKLKYSNQRSFPELLAELVEDVGEYMDSLAPDRQRFLHDIRDNRNFYTHRDDRGGKNILGPSKLYTLTQGTICLLKAVMLRRLGFSKEETRTIMDGCQKAIQWRLRVAEQYKDLESNA
jgi:hypothetical protein